MRALIATLTALMLFAATPVVAGDYEDGAAAYDAGDYQKAFRLWKPLAERAEKNATLEDWICSSALDCGDVRAKLTLGIMYRNGQGVLQDDTKAAYWFTKAAKHSPCGPNYIWAKPSAKVFKADQLKRQNCFRKRSEAQTHLGRMYANGEGVPEDDAMAVYWFKKAVIYRNTQAANNLGRMYASGEGVPQNDATAVGWYTSAAKQGNAEAQNNLGLMYVNGYGVPEDRVRAYAWFSIAAAQGLAGSKKFKEITAKRMTPTQIAEAQKLSRELWEKYVVPFQK